MVLSWSFLAALFPTTVLPCRTIMMFMTEQAFHGNLKLNPYNMRYKFDELDACRIEKTSLTLNGVELDGLPNDELYLTYLRMFMLTEQRNAGASNDLTIEKFCGGYFFAIYDFTTSLSASSVLQNPVTRLGQARYVAYHI
jgi:hypothetical protein